MSWEHRGITGTGNALSEIDSRKGRSCLIIGGAACVWDDLQKVPHGIYDKMVVNDIGCYLDWPIDHWVSMHAKYLVMWMRLRRGHCLAFGDKFLSHTHRSQESVTCAWHLNNPWPYSGMFAIQVAIALGYEKILLAGVPQDGTLRFFDPPWTKQNHADTNKSLMQNCSLLPEVMRCTRSMSGWTKDFFGGLEKSWGE